MVTARPALGDCHNFGRRVTLDRGRIHKPRPVLWEQLLLARGSPLRRLLDAAAEGDGLGRDAFDFLPSLRFSPAKNGLGGHVQRVALTPLTSRSQETKRTLARIVGRSLALWSWLGVPDLHWENLVLGVADDGRIIFAPLDVEMILSALSLPTETKLLPDADPEYADVNRHAAGVRRVLPVLGKPIAAVDLVAMVGAYRGLLQLLDRHDLAIGKIFADLPGLAETPIRLCLRGTGDYVSAATTPPWPPLLDAEAEQMRRGDIPYFFRLHGLPGIHYWENEELTRWATLPSEGDMPQLEPLLPVGRGLRSPTRTRLREDGLFAVLGAFDHPSLTGTHRSDELEVTFRARTLVVKLPGGEELQSRRNLRAFVGSVYLPCRCGEVRSVFVPPVTVCRVDAASPF